MGIRQSKQQHELLTVMPPLEPGERQLAIVEAREIMIALGDRLPADVEGWLSQRAKPGTVDILCGDSLDARYLLGLVEKGYELFDALVQRQTLLFLDRRQCYRLPNWEALPDGLSLASALLWSRLGNYVRLEGTVVEVTSQIRLFKLLVNEYYWTWITLPMEGPAGCQMPALDSRVKVLGISSWIGGTTAHLIHGVLVISLDEA